MFEQFSAFGAGFALFMNAEVLLSIVAGVIIGMIIGALPGLTVVMAISLALPFTFALGPLAAISMIISIYKGGMFGGSISAILIGTPGTPSASADVADGYPLCKKGYAKKALDIALYASVLAELVSNTLTVLVTLQIANLALKIGPAEYFAIIAFALTIIAAVSGHSISKGLIAGGIGMLVATVGMDSMYHTTRFVFGNINLLAGFALVPVLVGAFAIPEIIEQLRSRKLNPKQSSLADSAVDFDTSKSKSLTKKELKPLIRTIFEGSLIGAVIGIIPGLGAEVSTWVSYGRAKKRSKHPEMFGHGALDGLAAAESGNSGCSGPNMIPLLTLGIPGSTSMAILLAALMIQGLRPGPMLFKEHMDIIAGVFIALLAGNIALFFLGKILIKYSSLIIKVPKEFLFSSIFVLCIFGSYAINNSMFDVWVLLAFGGVGFLMKKFDLPLPAFIIAFILSTLFENGMRRALIAFDGNLITIATRPIVAIFLLLTLLVLVMLIRKKFIDIAKAK